MSCTAKLQQARREVHDALRANIRVGNRVTKLELGIEDLVRAYDDSEMSNFDEALAKLRRYLEEI